jgi:Endonuclease V
MSSPGQRRRGGGRPRTPRLPAASSASCAERPGRVRRAIRGGRARHSSEATGSAPAPSPTGAAGAAYEPGLLALREGPLLEEAVLGLVEKPDLLLVNATGRDHPRRAGLALHLGAVLDVPTVGITHRLLVADGVWPNDERGATSPFHVEGERVGYWLRTRPGTRPLAVHAAWRTDADTAVAAAAAIIGTTRTLEPLREARRLARTARACGVESAQRR